jgi:arylsulfatase A-like enzyme
MGAFEKCLARSSGGGRTLRYAFRAFCEWLTALQLIVIFHALWMSASWFRNLTTTEWLAEAAVEFGVALICAMVFALGATMIWLAAGGASESRLSRSVKALLTATAALFLAVVVCLANLKWAVQIGLAIPFPVRGVVVLACFGLLIWYLITQSQRDPGLDRVSESTQFLARRSLIALVPFALSAKLLNGVSWRPFDRRSGTIPQSRPGDRKNILLVTFDALAAQDMSLYGNHLATTPNLDRFAKNAIVFENMISASNFTTSSVTSILTGKTVASHGRYMNLVGRVSAGLRQKNIAAEMKRHGYVTGAIVANPLAHPIHVGLDGSFDYLPSPPVRRMGGSDLFFHITNSDIGETFSEATDGRFHGILSQFRDRTANETIYPPHLALDAALNFIETASRPYFLWVHIYAPHAPYNPPSPFLGKFLAGQEYEASSVYSRSVIKDENAEIAFPPNLQREIDKIRLRYDEFIAYADDAFGAFLGRFESTRGAADTVLMVSADHGENFEHGFWGHGDKNMWQSSIHVPLILKLPGNFGGRRVAGTAGHVDIVPTLLDVAGLPPVDWSEGKALRPMWEGTEHKDRERVSELFDSRNNAFPVSGGVAVVKGDEKFVLNVESGATRMQDLKTDPNEMIDISAREPRRVAELKEAVLTRLKNANSRRD